MEILTIINVIFFIIVTIFLIVFVIKSEAIDTNNGPHMPFTPAIVNSVDKLNNEEAYRLYLSELDKLKCKVYWRKTFVASYFIIVLLLIAFLSMGISIKIPWIIVFLLVFIVIFAINGFYSFHDEQYIYSGLSKVVTRIYDLNKIIL